ncbi:galactose oxidase-like domain-containing protein [Azohydromonas lata]|uniref:Galactose oxidase-like domain-containing protein n=1 Tax=Azohydromonas lata TaxID=45677 RepID=A0ABU5IQB0_9BURK|nr:galactose oxidase-like domain-containing protein [Azohydromonas lata]MDZ5461071.1 galactose oxidase-like domain-containing protein [Azohydromonas lata]
MPKHPAAARAAQADRPIPPRRAALAYLACLAHGSPRAGLGLAGLLGALGALGGCGGGQDGASPADTAADTETAQQLAAGAAAFNGGPRAHVEGAFGPVFTWPVMPIHMALLPDARVLAYGTDRLGRQGAGLLYTVWDPALGLGPEAFTTLPNQTGTDVFCAAQALLPGGQVMLVGGDLDRGGTTNEGNPDVNLFDPATNRLARAGALAYPRWYPTLVLTPAGERVVLGGRMRVLRSGGVVVGREVASTPEVFTPGQGWRRLAGAASDEAYGETADSFYYPRAWVAPRGDVFILGHDGQLFSLDVRGAGSLSRWSAWVPPANMRLPSAMFAPGRILSLRGSRRAVVLDLNGAAPRVQATAAVPTNRQWGGATVLADGQVWVNGGSVTPNRLADAHYAGELWNPATGLWTRTARAAQARLYHSAALLLADGSVLTGGGGAPGPLTQLNGEIYYPPYLFMADGSGRLAPRPAVAAPAQARLGSELALTLAAGTTARRVTLLRAGSATHALNVEQRFTSLAFTQDGTRLRAALPASPNLLPPGHYLLFVFDAQGVPSPASILHLSTPA